MKFHTGHLHTYLMHEADGSPIHCQSVWSGCEISTLERIAERACDGRSTLLHIRTARSNPHGRHGLAHSSVWLRIEPIDPPEIPSEQEAAL